MEAWGRQFVAGGGPPRIACPWLRAPPRTNWDYPIRRDIRLLTPRVKGRIKGVAIAADLP